jgi:hypothetical protein
MERREKIIYYFGIPVAFIILGGLLLMFFGSTWLFD